MENTLQHAQRQGGGLAGVNADRRGCVDADEAGLGKIRNQDAYDSEGHPQECGELGDGHECVCGMLQDRSLLGRQAMASGCPGKHLDERLQGKVRVCGSDPTSGHGIRAYGAGLVLRTLVRSRAGDAVHAPERLLVRCHGHVHPTARTAPSTGSCPRISVTSCGVRVVSVRDTSIAISYPIRPTSQVVSATTASTEPLETLMRKRKSSSISTMAWRTSPA